MKGGKDKGKLWKEIKKGKNSKKSKGRGRRERIECGR